MAIDKNIDNKKNKGGRPTLFKEEYIDQAFNYCLLGAIDKDLATFFGVQESTINKWKIDYPEFSESLKRGKHLADAEIASSLFNRAKGAVINTQQAFKIKNIIYKDGNRIESESIEIVNLKQEQPPDTTAGIFWLKNRKPDKWRDKTNTDITTNGKDILQKIDLSKLSDKELDLYYSLTKKAVGK